MNFKNFLIESVTGDAKKIVAEFLKGKGYEGVIMAKTVGFSDLARGSKVFVKGPALKTDEDREAMKTLGKEKNFIYHEAGSL